MQLTIEQIENVLQSFGCDTYEITEIMNKCVPFSDTWKELYEYKKIRAKAINTMLQMKVGLSK